MTLEFESEIIYWRGPAPFFFAAIPVELGAKLKAISARVTYGWGVIPVTVRLGGSKWETSLFPKQGTYWVPIKKIVQNSENLNVGDQVRLVVTVGRAGN